LQSSTFSLGSLGEEYVTTDLFCFSPSRTPSLGVAEGEGVLEGEGEVSGVIVGEGCGEEVAEGVAVDEGCEEGATDGLEVGDGFG